MGDKEVFPTRVQNVLDMEIVRLNLWSIKFNASSIRLEGYVRSQDGNMMNKVCSEMICKRMNATMLYDISSRFFELVGQIDREYQAKMGMPNRIIDEFVNGFPENWAYLINSCLTLSQRSVPRPIQDAPRDPIRTRTEPIVTLADETELIETERKNSEYEKDKKRKEREDQRAKEHERQLEAKREKAHQEALAAAEKKRKEEEEDAANYTFRQPSGPAGDAITPIRYTRGNPATGPIAKKIFHQTPVREKSTGPLASSTPQPPNQQPRRSSNVAPLAPPSSKASETQYASDSDLFAVPMLPPARNNRPAAPAASSDPALDFLDEMDALFDSAIIEQTPTRDRTIRRNTSSSPEPRRRSPPKNLERRGDNSPTRYTRYDDGFNMSRVSRRDATFPRNYGGRDESRMSRKRGYYGSPDEFDYNHRREDHERDRRADFHHTDSRYDTKRSRPREASSSSGRSVRFEEDGYRRRDDDCRDPSYSRNYRSYDHRDRGSSGDFEDKKKLKDIMRREKELLARLKNNHRSSSSRRDSYSSDEDQLDMADEWERENQEILDNSMMFGDGISKKRRSGKSQAAKKQPARSSQPKPVRKSAEPRKKARRSPVPRDNLNDSIASNRPRRACATPSTPAPKKITWPKRDLEKLKHVIELKKPSGADADWAEVTRLLAKEGVEPDVVKQFAITKLKWKEPVQEQVKKKEEEEEKKRRRGAAALIREGVRMREELMTGNEDDALRSGVDSMEDYEPEDVAADQSLLALGTPLAAKKKGGTRGSIMPKPVEDSPITRRRNSTLNSPRLDQTKAKDVETTLKYVQHLSMMQARPSSRANKSTLNKSTARGSKNTSMSLDQGARKALKIINRGRTIHEDNEEEDDDDEDDDDDDDDDDEEFDDQEGTSIY